MTVGQDRQRVERVGVEKGATDAPNGSGNETILWRRISGKKQGQRGRKDLVETGFHTAGRFPSGS